MEIVEASVVLIIPFFDRVLTHGNRTVLSCADGCDNILIIIV